MKVPKGKSGALIEQEIITASFSTVFLPSLDLLMDFRGKDSVLRLKGKQEEGRRQDKDV
jgi:hypothetical protein